MGSTAAVNARDNSSTNPNTDGIGEATFLLNSAVFATDYADLWNNAGSERLDITENGDARKGNYPDTPIWGTWTAVYTGTNGDGTTSSNELGDTSVRHGLVNAEPQFWLSRSSATNTTELPVYAISEQLTITPEPGSIALLAVGGLLVARRRRS